MIRDYEDDIVYSENGIVKTKDDKQETLLDRFLSRNYKQCEDYIVFATIVKRYLKVKGGMLVMKNVSFIKNKTDFEKIKEFLNEYQR